MLKLSSKRTHDSMDTPTTPVSCSPHRIQFLDSSPAKRMRTKTSPPASPYTSANRIDSPFIPQPNADLSSLPRAPKPVAGSEPLFTESQVRAMIEKAVADREISLRAEYDSILQERLQEQYRSFSKFHEDYISRQLKDSDFSYMS